MKQSEEIQMERETRRKREEVVAREIEEIMGGESLEEIREEEEEKLEWEREKQIREQLIEADRVKNQGQAAFERKGKGWIRLRQREKIRIDRRLKDKWRWQNRKRIRGLMKDG